MTNEINILKCVDIINSRVKPFKGQRKYLDTGGLNIDKVEEVREFDFESKPSRANQNVQIGDIILARMKETIKVKVISEKESNFMVSTGFVVLRAKKNISDINYLKHIFLSDSFQRDKDELCTGATQKAINNGNFNKLKVFLPPLATQKKIAAILDEADKLRQLDKKLIEKYDALTQSLFLDMFGDPMSNPKGWDKSPLKKFGKIITGNTPSRKNKKNYNQNHIEWLKTDNISKNYLYVTTAKEYLSTEGLSNCRSVDRGALLVACIAGSIKSIGRAALTDRKVSFNQQINAIQPNNKVDSLFLYFLFKNTSKYIQEHASSGMKRMLSKGSFEKILMILPPNEIQNQFAERVKVIEAQKAQVQQSLLKSEELFNSLLQKAFKGELT